MPERIELRIAAAMTARRCRLSLGRLDRLLGLDAPAAIVRAEVMILMDRCWKFLRFEQSGDADLRAYFGLLPDGDDGPEGAGYPGFPGPGALDEPADPDDDDRHDHRDN